MQVLRCFRKLYRTCQRVFEGDEATLRAARAKLKEEFFKNADITDEATLQKVKVEPLNVDTLKSGRLV